MKNVCRSLSRALSLLLVSLLVSLCLTKAVEPGAKIRLTLNGLNYLADKAFDAIKMEMERVPDFSGTFEETDYNLTEMTVEGFTKPATHVTLNQGISLSGTGAAMNVTGNWSYEFKFWLYTFRDSGTFIANASSIDITIFIEIGASPSGQPTVRLLSCSSDIGDITFSLNGSALAQLYNTYLEGTNDGIKMELNRHICEIANQMINVKLNKEILKSKVVTDVGPFVSLDNTLTQDPVVTDGYIDVFLKGKFSWQTDPSPIPVQRAEIPSSDEESRMVYVWGSVYLFDSFFYTAYHHNLLKYTHTKTSIPEVESSVDISLEASQVPEVDISSGSVDIIINGTINVTKDSVNLLKLSAGVEVSIALWISGTKVQAAVSSFTPSMEVLYSSIGPIPMATVEQIINTTIVPKLDELGDRGLNIPDLEGWTLNEPSLELIEGNLMIETDLDWEI